MASAILTVDQLRGRPCRVNSAVDGRSYQAPSAREWLQGAQRGVSEREDEEQHRFVEMMNDSLLIFTEQG